MENPSIGNLSPSRQGATAVKTDALIFESAMQKVNVIPEIRQVMVRADWWFEFMKRLEASGQTLEEYFTYVINSEVKTALFYDRRLLAPKT